MQRTLHPLTTIQINEHVPHIIETGCKPALFHLHSNILTKDPAMVAERSKLTDMLDEPD